jgi:hypothetical protein
LEAVGDTMRDAGAAVAGAGGDLAEAGRRMVAGVGGVGHAAVGGAAGRVVAGAGGAIAAAGRAVGAAGTALAGSGGHAGSAGVTAQDVPAADGLPRPHWVLRDRDGTPMQADVLPGYAPAALAFTATPDCVYVQYAGPRRVGVGYMLATGAPATTAECSLSGVGAGVSTYLDAQCTAAADSARHVKAMVAGQLQYAGGAVVTPATYYRRNTTTQACEAAANPGGTKLYPYVPVPADVAGLLALPPYTLEIVY